MEFGEILIGHLKGFLSGDKNGFLIDLRQAKTPTRCIVQHMGAFEIPPSIPSGVPSGFTLVFIVVSIMVSTPSSKKQNMKSAGNSFCETVQMKNGSKQAIPLKSGLCAVADGPHGKETRQQGNTCMY